ncbi:uncharacterized protein VTP21DRAFT_10462 [Calcarisporiella thermophila]|uniref:uncharacterized protein n=1 Tax=Calcarisporiella thermophila TaxID=911321 RepID=UPI0037441FA5
MASRYEENIVKHKNSLIKALESKEDSKCLDLLARLQDIKATEDLLRKTDIGKFLGKLRSHSNADIAAKAKDVVRKWKEDIKKNDKSDEQLKEGKKEEVNGEKKNRPSNESEATGKPKLNTEPLVRRDSTPSTPNSVSTPGTPSEVRTMASDGIISNSTDDTSRNKSIEMLYNAMAWDSNGDSDLIYLRAKTIEKFTFGEFKSVDAKYKAKIRSLFLNLKAKNNPGLREGVVSGEISVERFCSMSVQEMASEEQKQKDRKIHLDNLFKARGAGPTQAETDMFKCGRCKQRKCTYYQMQTRSADEPMTTFVTCVNCGNRWKFC